MRMCEIMSLTDWCGSRAKGKFWKIDFRWMDFDWNDEKKKKGKMGPICIRGHYNFKKKV